MGTSRSRFLRAFFIESSVFQRNNHILRILFYFCAETLLASRNNHNATTETRKKGHHIFLFLFFFYRSSIFCLFFRDFLLIMCSTLFGRFLCPHRSTNIVSLDRNGNAIVVSISRIRQACRLISRDRCDFDFLGNTHESTMYGLFGGGQKLAIVGSCHSRDLPLAYQLR